MDNLPLGIQVFDREGFSYQMNPAQKELLGLPHMEEGIGQFNVLTDPYSRAMGADKKYEKVYQGDAYEHEFEYNLGIEENQWNTREDKRIFHETIFPIKEEKSKVAFAVAVLQDKTEERKAEHALKESEERHRITLNSIGDAVISTDTDGNVVHMNTVAQELTGWKIDEAKDRPFHEVFHLYNARTGNKAINPVDKVLETEAIQELANHTKLKAKNGKEYQIADSAAPIQDEQGNLFGVVTVFRNATGEYRKNQQIKASNEELQEVTQKLKEQKDELKIYKRMVEGSEDMMAAVDRNYKYLCVNSAFLKYHQLSEEEVVGYKADEILGEQVFKEKIKPYLDKSIHGESVQFDMVKNYPEFGEVYLDINYYPLEKDTGIDGAVAVMKDITQRKKTENALTESEEKYRLLFDNMIDGFALHRIIQDNQGEPIDYEFIEVNEAFEKLTGLNRKNIIGKRVTEVLPDIENDPANWIGHYGKVALNGEKSCLNSILSFYKDGIPYRLLVHVNANLLPFLKTLPTENNMRKKLVPIMRNYKQPPMHSVKTI